MYFRNIDPSRNRYRWYALDLQPDLFGGLNLVRQWGRIGQHGGSRRTEHFSDATSALRLAAERRLKRAYVRVA
jgi:predicted DNA-binding WGR domain protein